MQVKTLAGTVVTTGRTNPRRSIIAPPLLQKPQANSAVRTAKKATLVAVKMSSFTFDERGIIFRRRFARHRGQEAPENIVLLLCPGVAEMF